MESSRARRPLAPAAFAALTGRRPEPATRRSPTRSVVLAAIVTTAVAWGPAASPSLAQVPTPASVLGFEPGADFRLATYEQSVEYFRRLDEASDRVRLVRVGRTSLGRDWWLALISSEANLGALDRHREIARRLADPRGVSEEEARALASEGRAIVDISGGLHASEVAGAQHTIALAYEMATSEEPRVRAIRDNVVLALWPSLNPDGQTLIGEWYAGNVGTPYEVSPMPWLYQAYVGHDNNRDAYMLDMIESRTLARVWRDLEPQIIYVHHQTAPFPTRIWLPPFAEPIASRAPPLISRELNSIGMAIAQMLESRGMPGATHMGTGFDAWYPGYVDYMPVLQHQAAFWTETALYRYATPRFYTVSDFPGDARDLRAEALYVSPWEGGWWRLGDAVEYMQVASLAVLDWAAKYREDLLYARWRSGRDVVERYTSGPPYAWLVPADQRDPVAAVEMLRRLAYNGIEIGELTADVTVEGVAYAAGTWVIRMDQPFAELARQLLEVQTYPDLREYPEGPPEQPYDAAGWTLPYQMGVDVAAATQPLDAEVVAALRPLRGEALAWDAGIGGGDSAGGGDGRDAAAPDDATTMAGPPFDAAPFDIAPGVGFDDHPVATAVRPPPGRITGSGAALRLDPAQNNTYRALNAAWDAGASVRWSADGGGGGGGGTYVVTGLGDGAASRIVESLALRASRGAADGVPVARTRIALYRPWTASMDEGWTRWLLERYGFRFEGLRNADVHAGDLAARYDVIVLPAERESSLVDGHAPGTVPPRYAGGLGAAGLRELEAFVSAGGTLVCMNQASRLCIDALHLPVRDAVDGISRSVFFVGTSILEARTDPTHPLMAGMPARAPVMFDRSPAFETLDGFEGAVPARWQDEGSPLLSGYTLGASHLHGRGAVVEARHGAGRAVLIGFRPQWRGQPWGSFRVLFNALLFHGRVAEEAVGAEGFRDAAAETEGDAEGRRGGR